MTDKATSDLWWKNAIVYGVDVKTFLDSNGDGWGDLAGLTRRLDYLRDLGVSCLWLMPCYPSPLRDDGYDIADYYAVDPRLGTLGDFVEMVRTAHALGLRVIVDLVLNHTSERHPWFQEARRDRRSARRGYYLWADEPQPDGHGVVFPGEQTETWTYDEVAGQYYFHRYHAFQPDLATADPAVRDEMNKIMGFWLELGVDGFRVDSLPFLVEKAGQRHSPDDPHEYLREMRAFLSRRRGDAVLLGEANLPPDEQRTYFGDPTRPHDASEAQLLFDFSVQANLWLGFARGTAQPVAQALRGRPAVPRACQYAVFVRHHDELTLEKVLGEGGRDEVFTAFAPDDDARIYGRGIRRRLAPLLGGDPARIRLALSLLMGLPGTPVLLYGDELGIGDDLGLPGRLAVRVPMQWSAAGAGGGFSTADADRLVRPAQPDGPYGYRRTNVAAQRRDPDSLLQFTRALIGTRRTCPEIGRGDWELLDTGEHRVLALRYRWQQGQVLTLHNFSPTEPEVKVGFAGADGQRVQEIFADRPYAGLDALDRAVPVAGYGFRWLRLVGHAQTDIW
jgi:maltose alpha-D-glucosyltransferase/alpha-amylase